MHDISPLAEEAANLEFLKESDETKASLWLRMGEQLELQNYPKNQIGKKVKDLVESHLKKIYKSKGLPEKEARLKSGYFYSKMSVKGWTDQSFAHNKNSDSLLDSNEINSADEIKLNPKSVCFAERYDDIIFIKKLAKFLNDIASEIGKDYDEHDDDGKMVRIERDWENFYEQDGRAEFNEFIHNLFANYFDEWSRHLSAKQSLLPKMQFMSHAILSAGVLISDFCSNYFAIVKTKTSISPKAWRKFITEVKSYSDYMRFIQVDAWKWAVLPFECPQCTKMTLRTVMHPNGLWEFICTNKKGHKNESQPRFTPKMFEKVLSQYQKKNGIGQMLLANESVRIKSNDSS